MLHNLAPFDCSYHCAWWGYIVAYEKAFIIYQNIILEFTPSIILFYLSLPYNPGILSMGIIFPFTYICVQYLHYIHPSTYNLSPHPLPLPLLPIPSP
jgi:hypothetical protein